MTRHIYATICVYDAAWLRSVAFFMTINGLIETGSYLHKINDCKETIQKLSQLRDRVTQIYYTYGKQK